MSIVETSSLIFPIAGEKMQKSKNDSLLYGALCRWVEGQKAHAQSFLKWSDLVPGKTAPSDFLLPFDIVLTLRR